MQLNILRGYFNQTHPNPCGNDDNSIGGGCQDLITNVDLMYADSSPRVGGNASRYFWLLINKQIYRSKRASPGSGVFDVWTPVTIPVEDVIKFGPSNDQGWCICFCSNARIITKALLSGAPDSPDQPWTAYTLPQILTGCGGFIGPDNFWTPEPPVLSLGAINGTTLYSGRSSLNPGPTNYDTWGAEVNTLPASGIKKILGYDGDPDSALFIENILAIAFGTNLYRWYMNWYVSGNDTSWTTVSIPEGNWTDIARSGDAIVIVGNSSGTNKIAISTDGALTFTVRAAPGWTPTNPKVIFTEHLYVAGGGNGNAGTFVCIGGNPNDPNDVLLLPLTSTPSILSNVTAAIPALPTNFAFKAIASNKISNGVIIAGTDGTVVKLLVNPAAGLAGTIATYNDWHIKEITEAPGI